MKKLNHFLLAALAAGTMQVADAMNYQAQDVLLVFRDGNTDVEFDLGPVSQFTSLSAGSHVTVSYDQSLVSSTFGSVSGVSFVLVATTATSGGPDVNAKAWTTDLDPFNVPNNPTYSTYSVIRSKIDSVGIDATAVTVSNALPFVASASDVDGYDQIVSDRTGQAISTMYGSMDFAVDAVNPTTMPFYQLTWNNSGTASSAVLIGAFTIDANGTLTFTARQLPPLYPSTISEFDFSAGFATIAFTTTLGNNYQLLYSSALSSGIWTPLEGATAVGDGTVQSLFDFSGDPTRFYSVQTTY